MQALGGQSLLLVKAGQVRASSCPEDIHAGKKEKGVETSASGPIVQDNEVLSFLSATIVMAPIRTCGGTVLCAALGSLQLSLTCMCRSSEEIS